jgi:NADPH:quinone reductase-like Zn-dependent oxidoreductase
VSAAIDRAASSSDRAVMSSDRAVSSSPRRWRICAWALALAAMTFQLVAGTAEALGADEVIDYNAVGFEDKVKDVDVVLNTVDADTNARSVSVIKPGGILVSVVGPPPAAQCETARIRCGVTGSATGEMLGHVSDLASQGKFHVSIEQQLPLADAAKAWEMNRKGHTGGKIILTVSH